MQRGCLAFLALGLLTVAAPASAQQPRLRPTGDVDVTYSIGTGAGPNGRPLEQRMRWLATAQMLRVDPPTAGLYVIIDYLARRMSVVREKDRSVIEMAAPDGVAGMTGGAANSAYVRRGEDSVAGLRCTEWETMDRDGRATLACITADGVLLRARAGGQTLVSATSVRYAPQDRATFQVPADYARPTARAPR